MGGGVGGGGLISEGEGRGMLEWSERTLVKHEGSHTYLRDIWRGQGQGGWGERGGGGIWTSRMVRVSYRYVHIFHNHVIPFTTDLTNVIHVVHGIKH